MASVAYMPRSSQLQKRKQKILYSKYFTESISDTRTHKVTSNLMGRIDYGCWFSAVVCKSLGDTLDAGLLARSQYPEGPATGHLDTGFSWFPCVYK